MLVRVVTWEHTWEGGVSEAAVGPVWCSDAVKLQGWSRALVLGIHCVLSLCGVCAHRRGGGSGRVGLEEGSS